MESADVLVGRYQKVKQIGKGGFGVVDQYRDLYTDSFVAIKTVPARFVDQETKRLVREIDIMIHLYNSHPHVMSVFEIFATRSAERSASIVFDDEDKLISDAERAEMALNQVLSVSSSTQGKEALLPQYMAAMKTFLSTFQCDSDFNLHIVMPLMKGDLFYFSKHIRAGHWASTPEFLSQVCVVFAFQLCFGLDYLHKCNIVHRDLKPDNVLIWLNMDNAYKSTAVIADFGLARDAHATETFYICTRHYRPPEVITNTSKGETSIDVWSLGCIFYELVTTRTLFNLPTALNSKGQWEGIKASQQLEVILNTIGTPSNDDIAQYMPPGNAQSYLLKSKTRPSILTESIRTHWRLQHVSTEEQEKWIDLISSCLKFFPQQRPSAEQLCCHPLFREYNVLFGENVQQYPPKEYHAVTLPQHAQRVELKEIVLQLVRRAAKVTAPHLHAADDGAGTPAPVDVSGGAATFAAENLECEEEKHARDVVSMQTSRRAFPHIDNEDLQLRFSQLPVQLDSQIDDALDEVLNQMELYTHDAHISRQLRELLTYFAGLKQLSQEGNEEQDEGVTCPRGEDESTWESQ